MIPEVQNDFLVVNSPRRSAPVVFGMRNNTKIKLADAKYTEKS
jgi:hypothetical protein